MKVLLLVHAVFPDPARINAGNSIRAYFLAKGLVDGGHQVVFAYPQALQRFTSSDESEPEPGIRLERFAGAGELAELIERTRPDAVLVGYWELVELLPPDMAVPVVLDVVAPRVLEAMFQSDRSLADEVQRMLTAYRRADRFLAGTERQRHFLLPWLIMAGFDCRYDVPIDVVPISTEAAALPASAPRTPTRFVSGGVSWPWRRTERWFDAIVDALQPRGAEQARFSLFAGEYVYGGQGDGKAVASAAQTAQAAVLESHGLLAYGDMQHFLQTRCSVGVELADRNVEREYSQSFRAMEFLRAGLPLVCNDYLEIAERVRAWEAGWTVSSPDELQALVQGILDDPDECARRGRNALALVRECFDYRVTIRPVLAFLANPRRVPRGEPVFGAHETCGAGAGAAPPVAADVGASGAVGRMGRLRALLGQSVVRVGRRLLALRRRPAGEQGCVVMVTRSDVFPADHGAAVKIDRTAAALSQFVDAVFLVTDDRHRYFVYRQGEVKEAAFPAWLRWLAPPRRWVRERVIGRGVPVGDAFLYYPLSDWSYVLRTVYLAARHPVVMFQAEFPAYARACIWARNLLGGKIALVEHNVEYERLRDQAGDLSPAGYAFLRQTELRLCNQSDIVVAVSERDRDRLVADGVHAARVHYVPHGVDLAAFDRAQPADLRQRHGIGADELILVYHGTYMYPPNLEAMEVLARRVMPALRQRGVRAKVLAIGNNPPAQSPDPDIVFTGSVASVAPYLIAADMAVVPLLKGGGTRMKILDYFAAAIPVISSAKGIEGIPAEHGVNALIVPDVDERFVDAILELAADRARAREIGAHGRAYVETLGWDRIASRYLVLAGVPSQV